MKFTVLMKTEILERERETGRLTIYRQTQREYWTSELAPERQRDKYDVEFKKDW